MASTQVTYGYWDLRGLGEPIKTFLEYLEIPYKIELTTDYQVWLKQKTEAKYLFPNLPYLVDGEETITESEAILAHLALKAGKPELLGKDEERVRFIQLKNVILDFQSAINRVLYSSKDNESIKTAIKENEPRFIGKLKDLNQILEKNEWVLGHITYLDFILAELIERYSQLDEEVGTSVTTSYPNLIAHYKRFLEIPQIKAYRQGDKFKARPHNGPSAGWK